MSLLTGQPVADTSFVQKKIEAVRLPDMNMPRAFHNVFYANGELTVVGGHTSGFVMTRTAEYYSEGAWHLMNTVYMHDNGIAVVMDEGQRVLIAGGHEKDLGVGQTYGAEMYYPESHTFNGFGNLDRKRAFAQGVVLNNGQVVIAGNHQGHDAFEIFDGQKYFHHVKDFAPLRFSPYLLPVASDDAIVFGSVWRNDGFQPCDTVERLKGEPFREPLLSEWMPMFYDGNSHFESAFIGDKAKDDYSYIVAAHHTNGEVAFIHVHDTVFTLLPTECPVPTQSKWGSIDYYRPAVADPQNHRTYLVGHDTTGRVYVVTAEYDRHPAPLTLYYTDPLEDFGFTTPILTPDGDLVITGGLAHDNFTPFASVWLLPMSGSKPATAVATDDTHPNKSVWWIISGVLLLGACALALRRFASLTNVEMPCIRRSQSDDLRGGTTKQSTTNDNGLLRCARNDKPAFESVPDEETPAPQPDSASNELLARITELMETERLYLNPNLKLTDVADALAVHHKAVSACINAQGCSFNQWINDYRLRHAKNLLQQMPDMKISTVALESGFANERTFFRVFKDVTGMSPKEWAAQQKSMD